MSKPCHLEIKTPELSVRLDGEAAFVRAGYMALREVLLAKLLDSRRAARSADPPPLPTGEASHSSPVAEAASTPGPDYVWVYRCTELYNKVYVIERRRLFTTGLGRIVDLSRIGRVYLEGDHAASLAPLIPKGKTLWSELTGLGHERLRTS